MAFLSLSTTSESVLNAVPSADGNALQQQQFCPANIYKYAANQLPAGAWSELIPVNVQEPDTMDAPKQFYIKISRVT